MVAAAATGKEGGLARRVAPRKLRRQARPLPGPARPGGSTCLPGEYQMGVRHERGGGGWALPPTAGRLAAL